MAEATLQVSNALTRTSARQVESQYIHMSVCKQVIDVSFQNEGEQCLNALM